MDKNEKMISVNALAKKYAANCERIGAIADVCEREKRERNESEEAEYTTLRRENIVLRMRMEAISAPVVNAPKATPTEVMRSALAKGVTFRAILKRDTTPTTGVPQTTAALNDTGIIEVEQAEMLKPLRAGLIYDKVGITIRAGMTGPIRWPKHGKAVAQFAGEGAKLTDSKIDFNKLDAKPVRLGIAIPVTREELEQSDGIVESVIREEMPAAIADKVNDALFTTDATGRTVYGPFVEATKSAVTFAGAVPTRKELLKMKASVTKAGIKLIAPCWVMTEDMKAELEDAKVDSGSGRFVCENDMILGCPVFTTPAIGEGNVGFGDWSYQAAQFNGDMSLIVDPYTLARNNATDYVLNTHFATATLRGEAFVLGKAKAETEAGQGTGATGQGGNG